MTNPSQQPPAALEPAALEPAALLHRSRALYEGCGEAIDWVAAARTSSARLDREADSLIDKLRRTRNLATRLGRASERAVSIGFFGLSQAGKSYLISALAAGPNGELETEVDGRRLNFIQHVNPPGHGKEATGLVTRFTRQPARTPPGYPLELSLFAEVDLAKVLGNAFFHDFDREQVQIDLSPAHLRHHLAALQPHRGASPSGGVNEDDVVDLREYFERRFPKTNELLEADFWPSAIALAPYLDPDHRATLFSVLWGEIPELTATYRMLRQGLDRLGHAEAVCCPLRALVQTGPDGALSQAHSIMNVDILERLGRDAADLIEVVPRRGDTWLAAVAVPRSLLAALAAELRFVLAEAPGNPLLCEADLLDFPGYRGRLAVANLAQVRAQLHDEQVDPVAQLVLRGKVAFLFERYTDDQEMNLLVLCAPSHKQSDVKDLGPVLETWVESTQGEDPASRARREPGLIWALTMFDFRLNPMPSETEDLMRKGWEGMMKLALLERFGGYEWLREWTPGRPFDNLFLVRKPRMASAVIETDQAGEHALLTSQRERLVRLRQTFCEDSSVRRHLSDPATAWDAMLQLNDGGITRLADYLGRVVSPSSKRARIGEQIEAAVTDLVTHRFGPFFRAEGAAEVDQKRRLAERVIASLRRHPERFAALLLALQPDKEGLRALYLRNGEPAFAGMSGAGSDAEPGSSTGSGGTREAGGRSLGVGGRPGETLGGPGGMLGGSGGEMLGGSGGGMRGGSAGTLDGSAGTLDAQGGGMRGAPQGRGLDTDALFFQAPSGSGQTFARTVIGFWISHLKSLPEDPHWLRDLNLNKHALEDLIGELITASDRLGLESSLAASIDPAESMTAVRRARLAERQVFVTASQINRFVDYLGVDDLPLDQRPTSLIGNHRPLFAPPAPIASGAMPELADQPINFSALFILDWFEAFRALAVANAGHVAGRDMSPALNARLGEIIARLEGRAHGAGVSRLGARDEAGTRSGPGERGEGSAKSQHNTPSGDAAR